MKNQKNPNATNYNFSKDFKENCLTHIVKIKQFCLANNIPFYMTFATKEANGETEYITSKLLPPEACVELTDDKFRKIILAERGFDLLLNHSDSFTIPDICDGLPMFTETQNAN